MVSQISDREFGSTLLCEKVLLLVTVKAAAYKGDISWNLGREQSLRLSAEFDTIWLGWIPCPSKNFLIKTKMNTVFEQGHQAAAEFDASLHDGINPYPQGTYQFNEWEKGWQWYFTIQSRIDYADAQQEQQKFVENNFAK